MPLDRPRFRRDLGTTPLVEDGYELVILRNSDGEEKARLYRFEHAVARQLNGRALDAVADSVRAASGLALSEEQLSAFVARLAELGLLLDEREDVPTTPSPLETDAPPVAGAAEREESEPTAVVRDIAALVATSGRTHEDEQAAPARPVQDEPTEAVTLPPAMTEPPTPGPDEDRASTVLEAPAVPEAATLDIRRPAGSGPAPAFATALPEEPSAPPPVPPDAPAVAPVAPARPRSRLLLWAILGLLAAAGVGAAIWASVSEPRTRPVSVRTLSPAPTSVYRFFDGTGSVSKGGALTLSLPAGGRITEVKPVGAPVNEGDILVAVDGATRITAELEHLRERLAFYQQTFDTMKAAGNKGEARQAELKIAEKKRLMDETRAALARVAVLAPAGGEIAETLVATGAVVRPGAPVVRLKGNRLEVRFELGRDDATAARRLAFCRIEIDGKPFSCEITGDTGDETHITVELPADATAPEGATARLARARFEGVFPVPAAALVTVGNTQRLFVARPDQRAEVRAVAVVDRSADEALVAQGLDVGDAVIVNPPPGLGADTPLEITRDKP